MRIMNLPNLHTQFSSADECVRIYSERLEADEARCPDVSVLLTAYLTWPNNEDRRNGFVASFLAKLGMALKRKPTNLSHESRADIALEMFGGMNAITSVALDQLSGEIGQIQRRWLCVADIFQLIVDMAYDDRAVLRRGPSISKAIDLWEYEHELPGHSQLRAAWSEFRDVAHLLVAGAHLAHGGIARATTADAGLYPQSDLDAPDAVLALAAGLQQFGLEPKPMTKRTLHF